jgi:hypothetical protein
MFSGEQGIVLFFAKQAQRNQPPDLERIRTPPGAPS